MGCLSNRRGGTLDWSVTDSKGGAIDVRTQVSRVASGEGDSFLVDEERGKSASGSSA